MLHKNRGLWPPGVWINPKLKALLPSPMHCYWSEKRLSVSSENSNILGRPMQAVNTKLDEANSVWLALFDMITDTLCPPCVGECEKTSSHFLAPLSAVQTRWRYRNAVLWPPNLLIVTGGICIVAIFIYFYIYIFFPTERDLGDAAL